MNPTQKVLIVEDDATSQMMMRGTLESVGYPTLTVDNGEEALAVIEKEKNPLIVLLDWELPGINGDEVCRIIRQKYTQIPPYIIFVTARTTSQSAIAALEKGASDFIRKPFNRGELRARVLVGERSIKLEQDLREAEKKMQSLAMHDDLTGLYNRRAMMDLIGKEIARTQRENGQLALVVADLDHFKQINDNFGHQTGDQVLQLFANSVQMGIRTSDNIARWGGEEFLILMPLKMDNDSQQAILKRLLKIRHQFTMNAKNFIPHEDPITVSFGVAFTTAFEQPEVILQTADKALYEAKRQGRNRIFWFASCADKSPQELSETTNQLPC
ncbi:MAG: diguanylate cyclase [Opitutales bacterium]|nr:diguanylate cyclase [Opitutales bacterium]MCH8539726.1 diguanylate cyclase [Opitutales bacterium]